MTTELDAAAVWSAHSAALTADDIPAEIRDIAKKTVLDSCGITLAGSTADGGPGLIEYAQEYGGAPQSTLFGTRERVPASLAALVNGSFAHALDYDDTLDAGPIHVESSVVPAALAIAERHGKVSGKDFITAVAAGEELMCRLVLATTDSPFVSGWHLTAAYGYFGAALASSRVMGQDAATTLNCLGMAYSQVSGNIQCFDDGEAALSKRLQVGFAAQGGAQAALLAQRGLTGAQKPLQGRFGVFNVYHGGRYEPAMLTEDLGGRYELSDLSFKLTPSCRKNQWFIDAAVQTASDHRITTNDIAAIRVFVPNDDFFLTAPVDTRRYPREVVHAQFSAPYNVAVALLRGRVAIDDFTANAIQDDEVRALTSVITPVATEQLQKDFEAGHLIGGPDGYSKHPVLEIETKDGDVWVSEPVRHATGSPGRPASWADLVEKFEDCAAHSDMPYSRADIDTIVEIIDGIEDLDDVNMLGDAIRLAHAAAQ